MESAPIRLLRFDSAVRHEPAIDHWLDGRPTELGSLARRWFEVMRGLGSDVRELLHDGHPTVCVGDAGLAYVNVFSAHVNVGFFLGAWLDDPAALLEGTGKRMRHVKLRPGGACDSDALTALIHHAYHHMHGLLREGAG